MDRYKALVQRVLKGERRPNRTGVDAFSVFGVAIEVDLDPFPLLTTKRVHWKSVVAELLWFLSGATNINTLDARIWNEWAKPDGSVGPIYGYQWRNWGGDQVAKVINGLRTDPYGRRHIISAWNVAQLDQMALPPCHMMVQFYTTGGRIDAQMYQRSADVFLGVPFNIASYALLTHMIAAQVGLRPGRLRICFGDAHIYVNHLDQIKVQLGRPCRALPKLHLPKKAIDDYVFEDCRLEGYEPHGRLPGKVAV